MTLQTGLPVRPKPDIHLSSSVMDFDRPGSWDEVAGNFPLKIVIGSSVPGIDRPHLIQKHDCITPTSPWWFPPGGS